MVPQNIYFKVVTFPAWLHFVARQLTQNVTTLDLYSLKYIYILAYMGPASENIFLGGYISRPFTLHGQ